MRRLLRGEAVSKLHLHTYSFTCLLTPTDSPTYHLEGVAAEAAAKKERELTSCSLAGAKDAGAPDPHANEKTQLRAAMAAGRGTAYFVHIQNAGGTAMCKMAQRNGLAAPQEINLLTTHLLTCSLTGGAAGERHTHLHALLPEESSSLTYYVLLPTMYYY